MSIILANDNKWHLFKKSNITTCGIDLSKNGTRTIRMNSFETDCEDCIKIVLKDKKKGNL